MAFSKKTVRDLEVEHKKVLVRVDFNTPIADGVVTDNTRIQAALPTITALLERGARVILISHLGRPSGEGFEEAYSLRPVADALSQLLGKDVAYCPETVGKRAQEMADQLNDGDVLILENLRFDSREKANDDEFAQELACLADLYVNDAFGVCHRRHASVAAITQYLPSASGMLLEKEITTLTQMTQTPNRPFVAILGGSKVSDKIQIINRLLDVCDQLIIGGGMCFTLLKAQGYEVGASLLQEDWVEKVSELMKRAADKGVEIILPVDVVVASHFAEDAQTAVVNVANIPHDMMGLDIGPESVELFAQTIAQAKTIFWNGPMGVFEMKPFEAGTRGVALAVAAAQDAVTVIGGGDSVAAVKKFNLEDQMTFISTGGGASMKLVEGGELPGYELLTDK